MSIDSARVRNPTPRSASSWAMATRCGMERPRPIEARYDERIARL